MQCLDPVSSLLCCHIFHLGDNGDDDNEPGKRHARDPAGYFVWRLVKFNCLENKITALLLMATMRVWFMMVVMVMIMIVTLVMVIYGCHLCDGSVPKADWLNDHHVKLHLHL